MRLIILKVEPYGSTDQFVSNSVLSSKLYHTTSVTDVPNYDIMNHADALE